MPQLHIGCLPFQTDCQYSPFLSVKYLRCLVEEYFSIFITDINLRICPRFGLRRFQLKVNRKLFAQINIDIRLERFTYEQLFKSIWIYIWAFTLKSKWRTNLNFMQSCMVAMIISGRIRVQERGIISGLSNR